MVNTLPKKSDEDQDEEPRIGIGPIGGQMSAIVSGLLLRFRLPALSERHDSTAILAAFSFINGCLSIGLMGIVALLTGQPFIFPSLGPTAFLFFYTPLTPAASPRNAVIGHLIGALAGWGSLLLFGLHHAGPALSTGVTGTGLALRRYPLGLTSGLMVLLKAPHPPAGATTLIISLGLLRTFDQVVVLMIAVVLLTLQAIVINRLAGLPYPLWAAKPATATQATQSQGGAKRT